MVNLPRLSNFQLENRVALKAMMDELMVEVEEAITDVENMLEDNTLTPGEKPVWILFHAYLTSEQAGLDTEATNYGITTEKTNYDNAITALTNYLATLTSAVAWNNLTGNTTIDGPTLRSKFSDVLTTKQALINAITAAAKVLADAAQTDADSALSQLTNISSNGVLDRSEKAQLILIVQQIIDEKAGINAQASSLGITTENTNYNTEYTDLINYLNGLSPAYTDTTQDTAINRTTFDNNFEAFYTARQALFNKMDEVASAQSIVIDPFPDVTIYADSNGTVKTGELPKDLGITASKGASEVTTSGTWSRTVTSGVTCTIGAATGILNITALSVLEVSVPISFVYSGVTRTATVKIIRVDDPPTNSGGGGATGGTSASTTTLGNTTGTAYDTTNAVSGVMTIDTGTSGDISVTGTISFKRTDTTNGATGCLGKAQYRVPAGAWADLDTEDSDSGDATYEANPGDPTINTAGSISITQTNTALSASTTYEVRWLWRRANVSGTASNIYRVSGTITATGS